ncbi:mechanosensitive ion channel family protein [Lysobacter hankyongensis]|uniref:Small-conductance mechanosensitive channel n=1 Tax=Lysobacter hankyongensis TaxID=1176535 RepID=A0ABP9CFC2_9GAMM
MAVLRTLTRLLLVALIAGLLCATIASAQSPADAQPEKKPSPIEGAAAIIAAPAVAAAECKLDKLGDCLDAIVENSNAALARLLARVPQLVLAVLVILIAQWTSRFIANRLHLIKLRSQNPYMSGLMRMIVRTAIMLIGILIALDLLGLTSVVGAVLGSAGVVGLVLGFAFRDIAENYIAGILLSVRRPFEPGDHVLIESREGRVISVNSRATVLMTMDGNHLQLPNSLVFKSVVLNYSKNPKRRFDFAMLIDAGQSIREAQTLAISAITDIEGVLDDPAPSWTVVEYGAAGIQLRFFGWLDQRESDLGKVRSEAIRQVKAAFAKAGVEGPRTTYHIVTSRQRDAQEIDAIAEPTQNGNVDTSVNRDIDVQVAQARADAAQNLLQPDIAPGGPPPKN